MPLKAHLPLKKRLLEANCLAADSPKCSAAGGDEAEKAKQSEERKPSLTPPVEDGVGRVHVPQGDTSEKHARCDDRDAPSLPPQKRQRSPQLAAQAAPLAETPAQPSKPEPVRSATSQRESTPPTRWR